MKIVCDGKTICLKMCDNEKNSMLVTGGSRMGKTFFASNLAQMLIQQGYRVHMIDLGEKWGTLDKKRLQSAGAVIQNVEGRGIELFFGSWKELAGCAKVIANAAGFRSENVNTALKIIFNELLSSKGNIFSWNDVICKLGNKMGETDGDEWSVRLYERLNCYGDIPNINFHVDASGESSRMSVIWDLSGLESLYVQLVAYLILYCMLCQQKRRWENRGKEKGIFIVVDEFQNLECDRQSIIGTCLTEGQKYNLSLLLLTQFLHANFSEAVISQFKQGGFRFHFRLTEEEAVIVSRQLACEPKVRKEIYQKLITLPRGQCLMMGAHSIEGRKEISERMRFVEIQEEPPKRRNNTDVFKMLRKDKQSGRVITKRT